MEQHDPVVDASRTGFAEVLQKIEDAPAGRFTDWYGFDTENDQEGNVTLVALVHEDGRSWVWKSAGSFIRWCEAQTGKPIVICHNLEYDLVNAFGDNYPYLTLNYLKGRLISAAYKSVRFWDSANHFRMTLAELGDAVGIKKLDFDPNSVKYVTNDARICLVGMVQARDYIASLGGRIGATSGSSAVSIWGHMTDEEFFFGPIDTPWLRKAYYGGRTEIFRRMSEGVVRGYDVNSMYPHCMLKEYPEHVYEDTAMNKSKGIAEVTISVPHDLFVAPLVHRVENGRLGYPVGVIRGCWSYDEVRFAESLGAQVLKVHKAMGSNVMLRPFNGFIKTLYAKRRLSKNAAERLFLKVLMNSLYGKIASKNVITRVVSRYNLIKKGSKRLDDVTWINYHRGLLDYTAPQPSFINVVWGSMVTAYSRITLAHHMLGVPPERLIYCDTDSVYTLDFEFPTSDNLGALKLEMTDKKMFVPQLKAYQIGDDYFRAKGVPRPRKGEDGIIVDYARQYVESGYTSFMAPIRFRQSIGSKLGKANQWVNTHKSMRGEYDRKTLSGNRYFPPVVGLQLDLFQHATNKREMVS